MIFACAYYFTKQALQCLSVYNGGCGSIFIIVVIRIITGTDLLFLNVYTSCCCFLLSRVFSQNTHVVIIR